MFSPLEEIKNKLDIVELIGQYVKLQKAGANYKGLCPFHKEKTPSFIVSPSRQIWHCFGACNEGGDIFKFIMKMESLEFKDALKLLADKAGVKLVYESRESVSQKEKILEINEKAKAFFQKQLENNKEVLAYLYKRGLKEAAIKEFCLGLAPDDWRSLVDYLLKMGYKPEDVVLSGLAISKLESTEINARIQNTKYRIQNTDIYDRFRSRIMFPIEDSNGRTVGFTGRIFQGANPLKTIKNIEAVGKYVNSPQTLVFDKSKILYGLSKTKTYLHQLGMTLVVEGSMDFLMGWQAGIKNIVAVLGASLTPYHLTILKRYNDTLVLGFDMDEAGEKAAERGIDLALAKEFNIKILQLPGSKDLAEYFSEIKDPEEVKKILNTSVLIMDFYFKRAQTIGDINNLEGKKAIVSYFLPKIKKLINALDRAFWLEKISRYINVERHILEDELKRLNSEPTIIRQGAGFVDDNEPGYQYTPTAIFSYLEKSRYEILAERIIAFLIKDFSHKETIRIYKEYFPGKFSEILDIVMAAKTPDDLEVKTLKQMNLKEEILDKINALALRADYELEMLEKFNISLDGEMQNQLLGLKQESIKIQLKQMENEIKEAEINKDEKRIQSLLKQFNQLSKGLF